MFITVEDSEEVRGPNLISLSANGITHGASKKPSAYVLKEASDIPSCGTCDTGRGIGKLCTIVATDDAKAIVDTLGGDGLGSLGPSTSGGGGGMGDGSVGQGSSISGQRGNGEKGVKGGLEGGGGEGTGPTKKGINNGGQQLIEESIQGPQGLSMEGRRGPWGSEGGKDMEGLLLVDVDRLWIEGKVEGEGERRNR